MGRDVPERKILSDRLRHGLNMLSILVTWALENAIETSDSMRSRGYGLHGRTAFSIYRFTKRDCCLGNRHGRAVCTVFTAGCASGAAFAVYDPRIVLAGFTVQGSTAPVSLSVHGLPEQLISAFAVFLFPSGDSGIWQKRKALKQSRKPVGTGYRTDLPADL